MHRIGSSNSKYFVQCIGIVQGKIDNAKITDVFQLKKDIEGTGIIMEYCHVGTLKGKLYPPEHMIRIPIPRKLQLKICCEIALGLEKLHSLNIVHGDLKPENILLTEQFNRELANIRKATTNLTDTQTSTRLSTTNGGGTTLDGEEDTSIIRLSDFGLSHLLERSPHQDIGTSTLVHTSAGETGFTPLYAAPELLQEEFAESHLRAKPTRSSDLYSFGILLWEVSIYFIMAPLFFNNFFYQKQVLTGKVPFKANSQNELKQMVLRNVRPDVNELPNDLPASVTDLLEHLWNTLRTQRPNATRCFAVLNQALLPLETSTYDIFFSHCWGDKDFLCHIYQFLSATGYKVWYDQKDMGHDLQQSMKTGILTSDIFLVCLDKLYQTRENCLFELRWAAENKKERIVVIVLEAFPPEDYWVNEEVKELCQLNHHMYIDLSELRHWSWKGEDVEKLNENKKILKEKLEPLIQLFMGLNCHPSSQRYGQSSVAPVKSLKN
jgi:serine/threonine protein kinase